MESTSRLNFQQERGFMKDYLSVIRSSQLFSGVSEEEVIAMLSCLKAERKDFPKDAFLLRAGDTAESIGLVLSGSVLVIQEDIWGNRNILSKAGPGQTFAAAFACAPRLPAECERGSRSPRYRNVSERKAHSDRLPLRLYASQPDHPQPAGRACREKPAFQRKAHAHGTAYHPGEAHVLFFRRSPAFGEI